MQSLEEDVSSNAKPASLEKLGSLKISVQRVLRTRLSAPLIPDAAPTEMVTEVSEKMMKGKAIDSVVTYGVCELRPMTKADSNI